MNNVKNETERKKFIEKYTKNYTGSLKAVYLYDCLQKEKLYLLDDYVYNPQNKQLHFAYFFRSFGKIWHEQYSLMTNVKIPMLNKNVVELLCQYFYEWLQTKNNGHDALNVIDNCIELE
nr:hypothetical protein [Microctonus hyperodae filamentous virus]